MKEKSDKDTEADGASSASAARRLPQRTRNNAQHISPTATLSCRSCNRRPATAVRWRRGDAGGVPQCNCEQYGTPRRPPRARARRRPTARPPVVSAPARVCVSSACSPSSLVLLVLILVLLVIVLLLSVVSHSASVCRFSFSAGPPPPNRRTHQLSVCRCVPCFFSVVVLLLVLLVLSVLIQRARAGACGCGRWCSGRACAATPRAPWPRPRRHRLLRLLLLLLPPQ